MGKAKSVLMRTGWVCWEASKRTNDPITTKSESLMHISSFCEKLLLKTGNISEEMSKKPSYVRTEVGGRVKSKA